MRKTLIFCTAAAVFFSIIGCASTKAAEPKTKTADFNITSVSGLVENLDTSIWNGSLKNNGQMFISFLVSYSGTFDCKNLDKLIIESPEDVWVLNQVQIERITEIDANSKIAVIQRLQCGSNTGYVSLGVWKFLLTDNRGNKWEKELEITGFEKEEDKKNVHNNSDKTESDEIKKIVTKAANKNEISALDMPIIKSVSKDENSIEIYFSVNDSRVRNGYFWFDVPGEKYYKDSGSMVDAAGNPVNGCRKFSTNGEECYFLLRKDDSNSEWFDKATACFFVVSDTNRVNSPWEERNRTVSKKVEIK